MSKVADQWRSRVAAVQDDIANIKAEMKAIDQQTQLLNQEHENFTTLAKKERVALQTDLKSAEQRAVAVDKSLSQSQSMKSEAELTLAAAARDYDDMSNAIRRLQQTEHALETRENLKATLENESTQWAEEEHRMRTTLQAIENQIRGLRKSEKTEIAALEQQLRDAENDLMTARRSRRADEGFEPVILPTSTAIRAVA